MSHLADQPALRRYRARDRDGVDSIGVVPGVRRECGPIFVHHVQRARTVEGERPPVAVEVGPGYGGRGDRRERRKKLVGFQAFGRGSKGPSRWT